MAGSRAPAKESTQLVGWLASYLFLSRVLDLAHPLDLFGVSRALDFDLRRSVFDLLEILRCKLHRNRPDVLFQAMQLGGTGNRNDPGSLRKQPRKCNLGRSG